MIQPVKTSRSRRLVDFADVFRENAAHGNILGAAAIILLPKRRFLIEVIGEAERDPVFTRGALQSLDDLLSTLAQQTHDRDTTL